jgi:hypothetical protein
MHATHAIPELDRKGLRDFGLVTGAIIAGLFGLFFPWLLERSSPVWPWAISIVLAAWGLIAPDSLRPVYRIWMKLGLLMGKITTPIVMTAIFFLIIAPVGIAMRFAKRDPLRRTFDGSDSYRIESRKPSKENLENPF